MRTLATLPAVLAALLLVPTASAQQLASEPLMADAFTPTTHTANESFTADCAGGEVVEVTTATNAYGNGDTASGSGGPQELGQSFVAPCTGTLSGLSFVWQPSAGTADTGAALEVTYYDGQGTDGTLLDTDAQSFTIPAEGAAYTFESNVSVQVTEGQPYTFFVNMTENIIAIQGDNGNPLPNDPLFVSNTGGPEGAGANSTIDLRFAASFSPPLVANEELPGAVTSVTAFPNPAASSATLAIELAEATEVSVAVYDVLGRQVAQLQDGLMAAGRTALAIDASSLAPGTYVARIEVDGAVVTRQLTVVR